MSNLATIAAQLEGMHEDFVELERDLARSERRRLRMPQWQANVVTFYGQAKGQQIFKSAPDAAHRAWLFALEVSQI